MMLVLLSCTSKYLLDKKISDFLDGVVAGLSYPCCSHYNIENLTANTLLMSFLFINGTPT